MHCCAEGPFLQAIRLYGLGMVEGLQGGLGTSYGCRYNKQSRVQTSNILKAQLLYCQPSRLCEHFQLKPTKTHRVVPVSGVATNFECEGRLCHC